MGATVSVKCPECNYSSSIRIDPGIDDENFALAIEELSEEHPNHSNTSWKFLTHNR